MRAWWKPEVGDFVYDNYSEGLFHKDNDTSWYLLGDYNWVGGEKCTYDFDVACGDLKKHCLPLLSIGQMIEFLDEHGEFIGGHVSGTESQIWKDDRGWALAYLGSGSLMGYQRNSGDQHRELCDALWEAVKEVLES